MSIKQRFDWADLSLLIGIVLLGWSVMILFGLGALLAYAGTVLVIVGGLLAWRQGRRQ